MRLELSKLRRERRQLAREEPTLASTLRTIQAAENSHVRTQQRMLCELKESEAAKRRTANELDKLRRDILQAKKHLKTITAHAEDANATTIATPEYLGQGQPTAGGKKCADRRRELLQRFARIGDPLESEQRNNFVWFQTEWDRINVKEYDKRWPKRFLEKLKGVLDRLKTDPKAFSKILFDEERVAFKGTKALLVPQSLKRPLSIEQ